MGSNAGWGNSGDRNSGFRNSGHWNGGDWNSGFFNSDEPSEIRVFNKPCNKSEWDKASKPDFIYFNFNRWIDSSDMTEQEKVEHPEHEVAGGYLKTLSYKEAWAEAWAGASDLDKELLVKLPNFDAGVFEEITGIHIALADTEGEE
jgi:hypothetical protein